MRYYLIAGEASGDLHASRLMGELRRGDARAEFRCIGGDLMREQGGTLLRHYSQLAYMGVVPVLMHLPTILRTMKECLGDILHWHPDALILVDYPGFNLEIAQRIKKHCDIPVFYYIAPKLWAWKEYRIKYIRRYVDSVFSILPFEVPFFEGKHHCPVNYVGNPTVDEVAAYLAANPADPEAFRLESGLDQRPVIALLAGSRRQEIADNLPRMLRAAQPLTGDYQLVVAGAPGIEPDFYRRYAKGSPAHVLYGQTYRILQHSQAALVTSGTATLETALFGVPQVVCYYMKAGWLANLGRRVIIKAPYISLVNLIADREVVPELVAARMTVTRVRQHLLSILPDGSSRGLMLEGYALMSARLGAPGAPARAASAMLRLIARQRKES
ncbi:MAG: lipid-A-disaccharide synthase [Prevotellaceae bacterium]|nr:lipid-A-disaccharide synthase [Prevotellaceae bacterium]